MAGISLYVIEQSLSELLSAREELTTELATANAEVAGGTCICRDPSAVEEELNEVEKTLAEYVAREVSKVDNIHSYLKFVEVNAAAARAEAAAMESRARRLESTRDCLKSMCLEAMRLAGKKRLDGTAGRSLKRQANGGLAPLVVDGWDAKKEQWTSPVETAPLPVDLMDITVTLPAGHWLGLVRDLPISLTGQWKRSTIPNNTRIREALSEPCPACHGKQPQRCCNGVDCACMGLPIEPPCETCNGTGNASVPGARLTDRSEHLRLG